MRKKRAGHDPEIISHNIKKMRLELGYTQEKLNEILSERLDRAKPFRMKSLSDWDNGKSVPHDETLHAIADIFHVEYLVFVNTKL